MHVEVGELKQVTGGIEHQRSRVEALIRRNPHIRQMYKTGFHRGADVATGGVRTRIGHAVRGSLSIEVAYRQAVSE